MWGTVRDAATDIRQSGATTSFTWYDVHRNEKKKLEFGQTSRFAKTDSTGTYYQCGLPVQLGLISEAEGTMAASGEVEYSISNRRVYRLDMLVSTDMVALADSMKRISGRIVGGNSTARHGHTAWRCARREREAIARRNCHSHQREHECARVNSAGEFTIPLLPSGTHALEARVIGFAAMHQIIDLRPNTETRANVVMQSAQTLAVFNVNAKSITSTDRLAFLERKANRSGYFLERKDIDGTFDMVGVMQGIPGSMWRTTAGLPTPFFRKGGGECQPTYFYDGLEVELERLSMHNSKDFRGIEIYPPPKNFREEEPIGPYHLRSRNGCGMVLVWSKYSHWN